MVDLQSTEKLQSLVPFLSDNSSLQYLNLISCISWPDETNILTNALSTRSDLKSNAIDNEGAIMLAESLVENIHFEDLALDGNLGITGPGWSAFLCLVCNTSSLEDIVNSNHTLGSLYFILVTPLGVDDDNLLRASLKPNREERNKRLVARRKILWGHVRGDFNMGDSSVATCAMPRILAWIGVDSNETNANLIQYHEPALSPDRMKAIRLGAIYRILQRRPALLPRASSSEDAGRVQGQRRSKRTRWATYRHL